MTTPNSAPDPFSTAHIVQNLRGFFMRGASAAVGTQVLRLGLTFAGMVVLARLLTPEDFGLLGLAMTLVGFVGQFRDIGLSTVTVQRGELSQDEGSTLFWINAATSTVLALACAALAPALATFYEEPRLAGIVVLGALGVWLTGLGSQHQALLTRQMRFVRLAVSQLVPPAAGVGIAAWMAYRGWGYWALAWQLAIPPALALVVAWSLCPWMPGRPRRMGTLREMLATGGGMMGFRMMTYITQNVIPIILGKFAGAVEVGIYGRAWSLFTIPSQLISTPVASAAIPALSRIADDTTRFRHTFGRIFDSVLSMNCPLAAYLIVFGDWAVEGLLGPQWRPAIPVLQLLAVYALVEPVSSMCNWSLIAEGRTRELMRVAALNAALFSAFAWIGAREEGALGATAMYVAGGLLVRMPIYVSYAIWKTKLSGKQIGLIALRHAVTSLALVGVLFLIKDLAPDVHTIVAALAAGALTLVVAGGMWMAVHRKFVLPA